MSVLSVKFWASRRALLAALLCAQLIAGVVTVAAVGPAAGGATEADHTDAVFRSAHAGSCLTWQPEPPQRPAFVQCSSPHLFEVVNAVQGDGDQESCAVSGRRYLGPRYDPNGRFAYGLLRSVGAESSGPRISLCGLQLPGPNGQQLPFRGQVAEQDQSRVWPPGTCLGADMKGGQTGLVPIDCAEPHSVEVVGPIDLSEHFHDGPPPSDAEQEEVLRPACVTMAAAYLAPKTLAASALTLSHRPIGPASWSAGSHQVLCTLAPRTPGPMTGSVKAPGGATAVPAPVAVHPVAPLPPATTATTVAPTSSAPTTAAAPAVAPSTAAAPAPSSSSSSSSAATHTAEAPSPAVTDTTVPPAPPASPVDNPAHPPLAPPAEPAAPAEPAPPSHVLEIPGLAPITLPWAPPPL
ncbi:septum formation family protein [Mycobacterium sp. 360MFTsu5.1]|uniref:septum formation family protein n=1 Tax=Mycobacterium sp. 360MFTsu5.1 TaxID=1172186 RepID=UPI00036D08C5|nr:septum formation family protein [Mycobacterium sp. 360MFTsu5.1]